MAQKTTWTCDMCGKQTERRGDIKRVLLAERQANLFFDGTTDVIYRECDLCLTCWLWLLDHWPLAGLRKAA